ncbi:MAG: dethiobiotin synthase [Actinomycetes bacterium]
MSDPGKLARGVFVTGTDTGVGKTFVSASVLAGSVAAGHTVRARKPLLSGLDEPVGDGPPADHDLLASVAPGEPPSVIAPLTFGPSVGPHLAAREAGVRLDPRSLVGSVLGARSGVDRLVVEGAGGLMVPICEGFGYLDLAIALAMPVVIAARPGLGTINHCLLTVEAARSAGLEVRAIVFGPWPDDPSPMERDNRATVESLSGVATATVPWIDHRSPEAFAAAGSNLPLDSIFAA